MLAQERTVGAYAPKVLFVERNRTNRTYWTQFLILF
jgi:hypothetical protein